MQLEALHSNVLRAKFLGHRISSFGDDIKAVTYREAKIEKDAAGIWHAHLIFDM